MSNFVPLNIYSHYSLLQSTCKVDKIVSTCKNYGYNACAITDYNSLSSAIEFHSACKSEGLKPIHGFHYRQNNDDIILLAKNLDGWQNLIKLVSNINEANLSDYIDANIIGVANDYKYRPYFQKDSFFGAENVGLTNTHYINREDHIDQRVLLCSLLKTTMSNTGPSLQERQDLEKFFRSDNFYLPSPNGLNFSAEQIDNTRRISDLCEEYSIVNEPDLPSFTTPNGVSQDEYLRQLCREGWQNILLRRGILKNKQTEQVYLDRIKMELDVITSAKLSGYFLIVQDYIKWARKQGWLMGPGRGCLSSDCKIYLKDGYIKNINKIIPGDMIIDSDGQTQKVKNLQEYSINNENLLNIKCYYGDTSGITLTKDHKVLAIKRKIIGKHPKLRKYDKNISIDDLKWYQISELKLADFLFFPKIKYQQSNNIPTILDLDKYSNNIDKFTNNNICELKIKNPLTGSYRLYQQYPRYIAIDSDFYRFLGLFTGDGWLCKDKNSIVGVCFNINEKENISWFLQYMTKLKLGVTPNKTPDKDVIQYNIKCSHLKTYISEIFSEYKLTSQTKHVPNLIKNNTIENIKSYLFGYFNADGCIQTSHLSFDTTSQRLAYEVKYLLNVCNLISSIMISNRIDKRGYKASTGYKITCPHVLWLSNKEPKYKWCYEEIEQGFLCAIRKINEISNINKVYDIEVENSHNYLTTNGIVHNSSAGCLISYLIGITLVDPIPNELLFSRFYNAGRNKPGHVEYPDIDVDVPKFKRNEIIQYLRMKYGNENVGQIGTFGRLQGRQVITEILRIHDVCTFAQAKRVTAGIPDEAKIADKMEEQQEESIIKFTLENDPNAVGDYCKINDNGTLTGEYATYFEQAIRLEGTFKSCGKHASGIVISSRPLAEVCPMVKAKDEKEKVTGWEMNDCAAAGLLKLDLLGTTVLDKLMYVNDLLRG